jgi:hypothetical protein
MKYEVKFSKEQLLVAREAMEFYTKFLLGVWDIPLRLQNREFINSGRDPKFWEMRDAAQELLLMSKNMFMPHLGKHGSYGINNENSVDYACVSYDMYKSIYEFFAPIDDPLNKHIKPLEPFSSKLEIKEVKTEK